MAIRKFTMKNRNGSVWDELYPKTSADQVITDTSNRFVTDGDKIAWNGKEDALGFTPINKAGDTLTGEAG
jgi:hypothetical protein